MGLRQCVLKDVPDWLKKWASLICEYIAYEQEIYPEVMKSEFPNFTVDSLKLDAKNVRDSKLQNVAITIDKVMRVLKSMRTMEPPLRSVGPEELFFKLWHGPDSLRDNLLTVLDEIGPCEETMICREFIGQCSERADAHSVQDYRTLLEMISQILLFTSQTLRGLPSETVQIDALCDTLY